MIWKKDTSTIYHWFGFWLIALAVAFIVQWQGLTYALPVGIITSQMIWLLKEYFFDKHYRKQPFNWADVLGGWLFFYVFKELIKTQTK